MPEQILTDLTVPEMAEHNRRYAEMVARTAREHVDSLRRRSIVEPCEVRVAYRDRDDAIIRLAYADRIVNELLNLAAKVAWYEGKFGEQEADE